MKKTKERVKRFLSTVSPAGDRDALLITQFLSKRKLKTNAPSQALSDPHYESITFEQFESWYKSSLPAVGEVVKNLNTGFLGLVTSEKWDCVIAGITLDSGCIKLDNSYWRQEDITQATAEEVLELQKALAAAGYDWCQIKRKYIRREIPQAACYVRLMELGVQKGIGIFKSILPDNTLDMYCVKMGTEPLRLGNSVNLGDANQFSFAGTYDEHRAIIQNALAEHNLIWNSRCQRIQKNNARAKIGEFYYWISSYMEIKRSQEKGSISDNRHFNSGNYFLRFVVAQRVRDKETNLCKEEMLSEDNIRGPKFSNCFSSVAR